ncbi:DUF2442 domain-containing protein [Skermanella mucosa]|uniref:DUF2442 domain-containing protein n=1 Tax=Skermanella mucosa TaxID=1789672 RepID=UPI001E282BB8|nr:DUF2442 domain-containing protein [Skermanella mucosa]UEM19881.1 DUF2442 domain-containing protein [Skermanella mucosa]
MSDYPIREIVDAERRGSELLMTEPRAKSAKFDASNGRIIVELINGRSFAFPPGLVQGLQDATAEQLAEVEVLGRGIGLHWESLDADLSVPGLLAGLFGTRAVALK